jgi:hypothetical protein
VIASPKLVDAVGINSKERVSLLLLEKAKGALLGESATKIIA